MTVVAPNATWVRIAHDLPEADLVDLARQLADRPDVQLDVATGEDLDVLRWFPGLRRLGVMSLRLRTLDGLEHVAGSLEWLTLGDTHRALSVRPIGDMVRLDRLFINGTWKDLETIGELTWLERLGVGTIDLDRLQGLTALRRFECGLGTIGNLELLPEIGRLEAINLWRLRGEHDLTPLGRLPALRYLQLGSTRSITAVPSFRDCPDLRWVALDEMRGITDLRPIADAPNLEVLLLVGMNQLDADSLRPFVGHSTLRAGIWGFGSVRRNRAAAELLPLPPANGGGVPWDRPDWDGIRHPTRT